MHWMSSAHDIEKSMDSFLFMDLLFALLLLPCYIFRFKVMVFCNDTWDVLNFFGYTSLYL